MSHLGHRMMGIKGRDLYFDKTIVFACVTCKFANVCNNGYCQCSVYDLFYYLFKISISYEAPNS